MSYKADWAMILQKKSNIGVMFLKHVMKYGVNEVLRVLTATNVMISLQQMTPLLVNYTSNIWNQVRYNDLLIQGPTILV